MWGVVCGVDVGVEDASGCSHFLCWMHILPFLAQIANTSLLLFSFPHFAARQVAFV